MDALFEEMVEMARGTMADALGVKLLEVAPGRVRAEMPVERRVMQPYGILHGGASVALAETVASIGSWLNVDRRACQVVGLEINANHVRAKRSGTVTAEATPIHLGKRTQLWQILITDEEGKLVCISRCTMAVMPLDGN